MKTELNLSLRRQARVWVVAMVVGVLVFFIL
jgi:hypothetical protein